MSGYPLQRLADEAEIRALSATYARGLDRHDRDLVRSVFSEDATTHYGAFRGGPDEMADMAMLALSAYRATQHLLGQILLTIDGDTAVGEVYFQAFHQHAAEDFDRFISGRYVDRYARTADGWRMTHRTEVVDWTRTEPTANQYFTKRPETVRGKRDHTDLSYHAHEA
jgi:hypothetical protein